MQVLFKLFFIFLGVKILMILVFANYFKVFKNHI